MASKRVRKGAASSAPEAVTDEMTGAAGATPHRSALTTVVVFPAGQREQRRFVRGPEVEGVGRTLTNWPGAHSVNFVHCRFRVAVGAADWNSSDPHLVRSVQDRSLVFVAALDANCSGPHSVSALQTRSVVAVGATASNSAAPHTVTR
jgi:hypothetical protein